MNRLNTVLADALERATILRAEGHVAQADSIERLAAEVKAAAHDYLTFIPEHEAQLRSGKSSEWLRSRARAWAEDGLAERRGRHWYYCRLIVPRSKLDSIVRAEARRGAA